MLPVALLLIMCYMATTASAAFKQIRAQSLWSPRSGAGISYFNTTDPMKFHCFDENTRKVTVQSTSEFVMIYGGTSVYLKQSVPINDVWILDMNNNMQACFAGGMTVDGIDHPEFGDLSFPPLDAAASAVNPTTGIAYVAGGSSLSMPTNQVWMSQPNLYQWKMVVRSAQWAPRVSANLIADASGTLVLTGGRGSPSSSAPMNDVWVSTNGGSYWTLKVNAGWDSRLWEAMYSTSMLKPKYLFGGYSFKTSNMLNDVWRMDMNMMFTQITKNAPWYARKDHTVVGSTTMALFGGASRIQQYNDVWITTDQQTWSLRVPNAEFTPRTDAMSIADSTGHVWIFGGIDASGPRSDIWTSSWTLNSPTTEDEKILAA